jgi:predicted ATPase
MSEVEKKPTGSIFPGTIRGIKVKGFKSIKQDLEINFRPITIISGANSGGKSSIIQPLLLIKQTIEAPFDQGALRLQGENVKFSEVNQLFWKGKTKSDSTDEFTITFYINNSEPQITYKKASQGVKISEVQYTFRGERISIHENMTEKELKKVASFYEDRSLRTSLKGFEQKMSIERDRWFLAIRSKYEKRSGGKDLPDVIDFGLNVGSDSFQMIQRGIGKMLHLPGLRGNPERSYPSTIVRDEFPGIFPPYVASIIALWKENRDPKLEKLGNYLSRLGLTWKVDSKRIDDTRVELQVGRLPYSAQGGARDLVNIADVGVGVSQTLPLLVALLVSKKNQMVYVEQPEIHLHPRAQVALADALVDAAKRGVFVIVETHSNLILKSLQEKVASGEIAPELTTLHWFSRDSNGVTQVTSGSIDTQGRYGEWPEDFADVELELEDKYLRASLEY